MGKKYIIFDMDGVLFDSIGFAMASFLARHPGATPETYREINSGNYHEGIKKVAHLKIKETPEEEEQHRVNYAENKSHIQLFEGIRELLLELHQLGHALVLNTNDSSRNCTPMLEKAGIKSLFDFVAPAELSKSKTEKLELIKEKYNSSRQDMLFVTDALGDVREADIAGIPTIAVTYGVHDESYFKREPHNNIMGIVNSVSELRDYILVNI